jgi:hypothetical protein
LIGNRDQPIRFCRSGVNFTAQRKRGGLLTQQAW